MNSKEIREIGPDYSEIRYGGKARPNEIDLLKFQGQMLQEIAFQLAVLNERKHKQDEDKLSSRKTAGHKEQRTVMRKTSTTTYFRPSSWNTEVSLEQLNSFLPDPGQPALDQLEIGSISIGLLGTKEGVEVKRTR